MRVRNRKGATELLEANPQYVVLNPLEAKGKWRDLFGNDHPIHVEVGVPNIKLLWVDGSDLTDYFEDGEIDRLYLNFSDPWPKKRHEKRRLTYKSFLDTFKRILPENGEIHFKTDNRGLFEYSLVSFSQYGMKLNGIWLDLHASGFEGNVMTEYEQKFSSKGQVIYRVEAEF